VFYCIPEGDETFPVETPRPRYRFEREKQEGAPARTTP
jgi:hypothetical protein